MKMCRGDIKKIGDLMNYSDVYRDPARFIDTLDDDIEIDQISDMLLKSHKLLQGQATMVNSAFDSSDMLREKLEYEWIKASTVGFSNIKATCNACSNDLRPLSSRWFKTSDYVPIIVF